MRLSLVSSRAISWNSLTHTLARRHINAAIRQRQASSHTAPIHLDLQAIDQKWQKRWDSDAGMRAVPRRSEKAYILSMFPYPSGTLHMGHLRVYTITDVLARFKQMQGYDVLHPIGWDAFGLPAENAAIERGIDPAKWTEQNISKMKEQLRAMNGSMDWSREFMTCDPDYYKHTQRIFLSLYEHGLAYQAKSFVNYDPVDKTVLANEQVDANGCSWRSGAKVEQINLKQWFLKTTAFKEPLLDDLDFLEKGGKWPSRVLNMQRNWLGRSEGAQLHFPIEIQDQPDTPYRSIEVFTTRTDTLFGVQYLAVSVSHPLVQDRAAKDPALAAFLDGSSSLPEGSKAGHQLSGVIASNPLSSLPGTGEDVRKPIPVFVAPYVIGNYGSGALMGVPGHDTRDNAFWRENRPQDPILTVVEDSAAAKSEGVSNPSTEIYTAKGQLSTLCGRFAGVRSNHASDEIIKELQDGGNSASKAQTWRLRDWLISRQRYWGTPIPIIHCGSCGTVPVPIDQLPVELPKMEEGFTHGTGNPLETTHDWLTVDCPKCGGVAKRDTDTMDTFACSSWYMFRFTDPTNSEKPYSEEIANRMMPVDIYVGGVEHAILHLLYARFISKFFAASGQWPAGKDPHIRGEPFTRLISQGMVHGITYSDPTTGRFLKPDEISFPENITKGSTKSKLPTVRATGMPTNITFEKMSKSKYNGVDPLLSIAKYGADVIRMHMIFQAPVSEVLNWDDSRVVGVQRWFQRIWRTVDEVRSIPDLSPSTISPDFQPNAQFLASDTDHKLDVEVQNTIQSLTTALSETCALNTCVSDLMQLTNALVSAKKLAEPKMQYYTLNNLLRLMAPFAPAFTAECWERLHTPLDESAAFNTSSTTPPSIFNHPYPTVRQHSSSTKDGDGDGGDGNAASPPPRKELQTCAIMQNGRLRFALEIEALPTEVKEKGKDEVELWVLQQIGRTQQGNEWLKTHEEQETEWDRIVVVQGGRTVNFVKVRKVGKGADGTERAG